MIPSIDGVVSHCACPATGNLSDQLLEPEKSLAAYENVLRHNPLNVTALTRIARIYHSRQQFREVTTTAPDTNRPREYLFLWKAIAYYHRVVTHDFMREGQSVNAAPGSCANHSMRGEAALTFDLVAATKPGRYLGRARALLLDE